MSLSLVWIMVDGALGRSEELELTHLVSVNESRVARLFDVPALARHINDMVIEGNLAGDDTKAVVCVKAWAARVLTASTP